MLQIFSTAARLAHRVAAASATRIEREHWLRDPLAHPVIDAMSVTELADLPARSLRSCCRE